MEKTRFVHLKEMIKEYHWQKRWSKLKTTEQDIVTRYLIDKQSLTKSLFEIGINRLFLDQEKPKNWTLILEILSNVNSRYSGV